MDDVELLMQENPNVSRKEIEEIRDRARFFGLNEGVSERSVRRLHNIKEYVKVNGKNSSLAGPIIYVLSVDFLPNANSVESLPVYGKIFSEFYDDGSGKLIVNYIYNSKLEDVDIIKPNGGCLMLSSDYNPLNWKLPCMPLNKTKLVVDVRVGGSFFKANFDCLDEDMTEFECLKSENVYSDIGVLVLRYIAIPMAIYAYVEVEFYRKKNCQFDIQGKIMAGGSGLEKCTLFEKQGDEFQRLNLGLQGTSLRLSRCLVGLPIYSSLVVDLDLSEFGSDSKILKETIEFQREPMSEIDFIIDDILVKVSVNWLSTTPQGRSSCVIEPEPKNESSDEEMEESCVPEESSHLQIPWKLGKHQSGPFPISSLVVYSIFIGRENLKNMQVYGFVELSCTTSSIYGFKRDVDNALELGKDMKAIPVLNGFLSYEYCDSLKMKVDLRDALGSVHIKGYVEWDDRSLEFGTHWLNKQLCSVFESEHGFAAIHYSIFPEAIQGNVEILCRPKQKNGMYTKIYGSIVAQYNSFDYTSRYNQDYYRFVLFQRSEDDPAQTNENGAVALSRSLVVVPINSTLIIEAILCMGDNQVVLSSTADIKVGTNDVILENNDYCIHVYVKWS